MGPDERLIVQRILGGKTDEYAYFLGHVADAEEVAQDAFVSAYIHLADYRTDMPFATWVCRMAYNKAISMLRTRKRQLQHVVVDDELLEKVSNEMVSEAFGVPHEGRVALLEKALNTLNADERLLIALFYENSKPLREIAYILGMNGNDRQSVNTLAVRIGRIRKKLYVMIKRMEESDGRT